MTANQSAVLVLATIIMVLYGYVGTSVAQLPQDLPDSNTNSCTAQIISDIKTKYALVDEEKAKKSASNHSALKSEMAPYKLSSVSQTWTNDPVRCTAELKNILVQYTADSDGKKRLITILVDPESYTTKSVTISEDTPTHDAATSPSWGGYAIRGAAAEPSSFVYRSTMNWIIPIPNDPPQLDCGTLNAAKCYISVWTGLSKTIDGTSDMAQVGTDSICLGNNCSSGRQYKGWLETIPGGHISDCTGNTYAAGDSMYGEVVNQKKDGGPVNKYDFYLIDTTQGQTCSALNHTFGTADPHYGLYMTERPNFGGTLAHLADFGTISNLYGTIYYDGTIKNIYTPYSSGSTWYRQWLMYNGVNNEAISEINSSNYFSVTWLTSQGT